MIKIQNKDFSFQEELIAMKNKHENIGAVGSFIGIVRDKNLPSIKVFRSLGFSFNFKNKIYYFSKYF